QSVMVESELQPIIYQKNLDYAETPEQATPNQAAAAKGTEAGITATIRYGVYNADSSASEPGIVIGFDKGDAAQLNTLQSIIRPFSKAHGLGNIMGRDNTYGPHIPLDRRDGFLTLGEDGLSKIDHLLAD